MYGGGGNSGAPYTHDFVELFNRGAEPASLARWSLQHASATGTGQLGASSGQITELPSITLQPGQSYLVQQVPPPARANVVVSQVYGGGGNSGATLTHDFIELRNLEAFAVSVAGWSVQYASAGGATWQTTPLHGAIPAGGFYLVQQAAGSGGRWVL